VTYLIKNEELKMRLGYASLCETGVSPTSKKCGQKIGSVISEEKISMRDRQEHSFQRKLSNEGQLQSHESLSEMKKYDWEKERLKRENEWLRQRLSDANVKLREFDNRGDPMSTVGNNASVSSCRSSRMRCSVLGRKKNKEGKKDVRRIKLSSGRCSPSDASTVVTGSKSKSKSKSKSVKDTLIRHNTELSFPKKTLSQNIWSRCLSQVSRGNSSPRRTSTEVITPPCTPERSLKQDNWSTKSNFNRHLNTPPWSGAFEQQQGSSVLIFQPQPLGIEACLPTIQNDTKRRRDDMFLSFRSAVSSEILSVQESKCLQEI